MSHLRLIRRMLTNGLLLILEQRLKLTVCCARRIQEYLRCPSKALYCLWIGYNLVSIYHWGNIDRGNDLGIKISTLRLLLLGGEEWEILLVHLMLVRLRFLH